MLLTVMENIDLTFVYSESEVKERIKDKGYKD